jgi:hypothetical protein
MLNKLALILLFLLVCASQGISQPLNNLKEINKTWDKFYEAFDSLDYKPMAEIHSKNLVRIPDGKKIIDYDTYINGYKTNFEKARNNNVVNKISLRFIERINNDSIASERGIYKLIRIDKQHEKQVFYGQFHVVFKKENGMWKIIMDYDSNEGDTIGESNYANAKAITEFDAFIPD